MTALRKAIYYSHTSITGRIGTLLSATIAWLLAGNFFDPAQWAKHGSLLIALSVGLSTLVIGRLCVGWPERRHLWRRVVDRVELGFLCLLGIGILIQATGGTQSVLRPVLYLVVALLVGLIGRLNGVILTVLSVGIVTLLHLAIGPVWPPSPALLIDAGFVLLFGCAGIAFYQFEIAHLRREQQKKIAKDLSAVREEAREFRLIRTALSSPSTVDRTQEELKLARSAVEAIHQGMFFVLELLKKSLDLQTCVLLWLDATGDKLRIKELVTDSQLVVETPISSRVGAIASIVKDRILVNLRHPRQTAATLPYYAGPEEVGAFVGIPVIEDGHLRGVLCADRRDARPFTATEEQVLQQASRQVLRAIQTERIFAAVERSKYEHERFYRASSLLNGALTLAQVYDTALSAANQILEYDVAAITLYDTTRQRHVICRVFGLDSATLEGLEFANNSGLVAMAIKNRHFLPADLNLKDRDTVVFTRRVKLPQLASLVVLPLIIQDQAIGTFVIGCTSQGRLTTEIRDMLGVISNQIAVSVENAKMYKRMEEMATTDGLTQLPNHRTFQARFDDMLHRAQRHQKPLSLILTDVDKFKSVNDTYGHPVGDAVLRCVAKVLAQEVRKVDVVARYGGEEFAVVLEETDAQGAKLLCERIRQQMASQVMSSDKGAFRVTLSLGVATFPSDGDQKQILIERADQALYAAKHAGRNRTICYSEIKPAKRIAHG